MEWWTGLEWWVCPTFNLKFSGVQPCVIYDFVQATLWTCLQESKSRSLVPVTGHHKGYQDKGDRDQLEKINLPAKVPSYTPLLRKSKPLMLCIV